MIGAQTQVNNYNCLNLPLRASNAVSFAHKSRTQSPHSLTLAPHILVKCGEEVTCAPVEPGAGSIEHGEYEIRGVFPAEK